MKKVAIFSNSYWSIINFRRTIIQAFVDAGCEVVVISPPKNDHEIEILEENVRICYLKNLKAKNKNVLQDIKLILELRKIFREEKFDYVYSYTIKPNLYTCIASWWLKQKNYPTINGLGHTLSTNKRFIYFIFKMYKWAFRNAEKIFFQNKDDAELLIDNKVIPKSKTEIVNGTGVELDLFQKRKNKINPDHKVFIYCARLVEEKGIKLLIEAAREIKKLNKEVTFQIYGLLADNPNAIKEAELIEAHNKKIIDYRGSTNNVNEVLENADIAVMPSYYREGIPRFLLECLSKGLPIITTNMPGCKETVVNNKNGFLIEPKSLHDLIEALQKMINITDTAYENMSNYSRALAEEKFDINKINETYLAEIT